MKTDKNILIAFLLNISFSFIELIGGLFTGSIAILSDSLHDFGDALSIGISYYLERISKRKPDAKHTYGYVRYSVMGGVITTVILLVGSCFVVYEAIKRIIAPTPVNYDGMLVIAIFGVVVNILAAYYTKDGNSLNEKSVNLHMLEDVLGWVVVLIGSILIKFTNIMIIDAILSIVVAIFIFVSALKNMKKIVAIFLEITPSNIDINKLKEKLLQIKGVHDIHHIHIRSIDDYSNYITMHVVVEKYSSSIKEQIKKELREYDINHSTIEMELLSENCHNKECHVEVSGEHHHHH